MKQLIGINFKEEVFIILYILLQILIFLLFYLIIQDLELFNDRKSFEHKIGKQVEDKIYKLNDNNELEEIYCKTFY